jgi:ABC-type glycerol-3-phosphate transport system substrate-binding protein
MERLSRRSVLRTGLGLGAAAGLAPVLQGCGDNGEGSSSDNSGTPQGTVKVWMHTEELFDKVFQSAVADYRKQFPNVTIEPLQIPLAQLDTKLQTALIGDQAPDIVKTGGWTLANYIRKRQLEPVSLPAVGAKSYDEFAGRYQENALSSLTFDEKVYGVPIDFNTTYLFYRRDRFAQAGLDPDKPPTTWEQVADYSKKLTTTGPRGKKIGWQWFYTTPIWSELELTPLVRGLGGRFLSEDGSSSSLNSPEGIKALEYVASVGDPKLSNKNDVFGMFADGDAAMQLSGVFSVSLTHSFNSKAVFGETFDCAPVPQWADAQQKTASGYTWAWTVPAKAKNKFTAWHFINYLQARNITDASLKTAGLIVPTKGWQDEPVAKGKEFQILADQVSYADFGTQVPAWNEMAQALTDAITAVATAKLPADKAAKDFDDAMKGVLG